MYKTDDFDFELDDELIAQTPLQQRDSSRLLVLNRQTKTIEHKVFSDLLDYLNKGDVLVLNDSRVLPARLFGVKEETKAHIEVLLLKDLGDDVWQCLCKPAKRVKEETIIDFGEGKLKMKCLKEETEGLRECQLIYDGILLEKLEELGTMPLPPYIKEQLQDQERYQTIYSKVNGSAAAPTAGLHFTEELLSKIKAKGVVVAYVTLHVGLGTFRPVSVEDVTKHTMHSEYYSIDEINVKLIKQAKANGGQLFSVGTTTTRTLETIMKKYQELKPCFGNTDIFIYPGFEFKIVDHQLTNFHLPKSTLMMLISAFATRDLIMKAYREAVEERYRFFSFGDSMLIM